jgi:mono/diheme cytochrome c family protein
MVVQGWIALLAAALAAAGCDRAAPAAAAAPDPLAPLRGVEDALRRAQLAPQAPPEQAMGANPVDVAALGVGAVGVLAGDDAVVLLDEQGAELARADAPAGARAVAVAGDSILVAGQRSPVIARYRRRGDALIRDGAIAFPGTGIAAIAAHPGGAVYAADLVDGALRVHAGGAVHAVATCRGAARGVAIATAVAFACVLDHRALIVAVDDRGLPRGAPLELRVDGPLWSIAIAPAGDDVLVAVGGAEDHPLDRSRGFFGHIDSFAFVYRLAAGAATRVAAVNLSAHGVVTPKWLAVRPDGDAIALDVAGFGGGGLVSLAIDDAVTVTAQRALPPGIAAVARTRSGIVAADPLLDAWLTDGAIVPVAARRAAEPSPEVRLGELLFFTTLLAPHAISDDAHSRFTCETCHWEGYADGRIHYTGRDDVHATTRALRGLVQGRPYFSRANDTTLAGMVHAEFGVASRGTNQPSWFALDAAALPWLRGLPATVDALAQRAAFMTFLGAFGHEISPTVGDRTTFGDDERRGAALFARRCEGCHQARLLVDDASTRVDASAWERHVMSPTSALTWASDQRWQTGVEPYVHPDGARVPSLRRLYRKHPYFTSGSADDLATVIARARLGATLADFRHQNGTGDPLPEGEHAPLLAFIRLL